MGSKLCCLCSKIKAKKQATNKQPKSKSQKKPKSSIRKEESQRPENTYDGVVHQIPPVYSEPNGKSDRVSSPSVDHLNNYETSTCTVFAREPTRQYDEIYV